MSTRATARRPRWTLRSSHLGDAIIPVFTAVAFVYLLVPIVYTVAYSFNDAGRKNLFWHSFTWNNWLHPCNAGDICTAFTTSLQVGAVATVGATILGTLLAVALARFRFWSRPAVNLLVFLPMSTPEVVLGSALAAQFLAARIDRGFWTIVIVHIMFCISFVVVTVKARVASLDPALEEAAGDLYASPAVTFWRVTFPLLLPGIAAAALLSFSLSFDDYIITYFNAGTVTTFPIFVYTAALRGIPPQANVLATIMFLLALLIVAVAQLSMVRRRRKDAARTAGTVVAAPAPVPTRVPARPLGLVAPRAQVSATSSGDVALAPRPRLLTAVCVAAVLLSAALLVMGTWTSAVGIAVAALVVAGGMVVACFSLLRRGRAARTPVVAVVALGVSGSAVLSVISQAHLGAVHALGWALLAPLVASLYDGRADAYFCSATPVPTTRQAHVPGSSSVPGLSVQGQQPRVVATVSMVVFVASVLGALVASYRIPNAFDPELGKLVVELTIAVPAAVISVLLMRGSSVARLLAAVWLGLVLIGFFLVRGSWTTIDRPVLVGLLVSAVYVALLFTGPANRYFGPLTVPWRGRPVVAAVLGVVAVVVGVLLGMWAVANVARSGVSRWFITLVAAVVVAVIGVVVLRARPGEGIRRGVHDASDPADMTRSSSVV